MKAFSQTRHIIPGRESYVDRELETYNHRLGRSMPTYVAVQGNFTDKKDVDSDRGFSIMSNSERLSRALGVRTDRKWNKADVHRVFQKMDADGSLEVDYGELKAWVMKNKIFAEATSGDAFKRLRRIFDDIDTSGDGSLDFEEFFKFCKLLEREQRNMQWASKHYLTALPKSQAESNSKRFTIEYIESELQKKIEQFTSQDKDRFRQILGMFRTQIQKAGPGRDLDPVLGITRRDFRKMLSWLGLFASEDQAEHLFNKYDANGDGTLTVHEFLTQARPADYPGSRRGPASAYHENKGGKKIYGKRGGRACGGEPIRLPTPHPDCFVYTVKELAHTLRTKMTQSGKVGQTYTDARGKRDLLAVFQFFDKANTGVVSIQQLRSAFKMAGVNNIGRSKYELIMYKFGREVNKTPVVDYKKLTEYVWPNWGKKPDFYVPGTTLDLRNRDYVGRADGSVGIRDVRSHPEEESARSRKSTPGMRKSESVASLGSNRKSVSAVGSRRALSRASSTTSLQRPMTGPGGKGYHEYAPFQSSLNRPSRINDVKPCLKAQVNPLQSQLPSDFNIIRAQTKNVMVL